MHRIRVHSLPIAEPTMVDPMDDIVRQARQGSVSAIIQVLNEKLADSGVRTRAIFAEGVLQLLCEAAKPEQLEQKPLVDRIREILEAIQLGGIRRININSRIVREQQLLWLEEINRDPENQLLWSQEITLTRPNPLKRLMEGWRSDRSNFKSALPQAISVREDREKRQFWRGIVGGASLSLLLLLIGWVLSDWLGLDLGNQIQAITALEIEKPTVSPSPAPEIQSPPVPAQQDPFVQAVRIAERAASEGKTARSPADWLDLATRWQRASELMANVKSEDERYSTARNRTQIYSQNSKAALQQAEQRRSQGGE